MTKLFEISVVGGNLFPAKEKIKCVHALTNTMQMGSNEENVQAATWIYHQTTGLREFPGGQWLGLDTYCRGPRDSVPSQGTRIPQTARPKKQTKNTGLGGKRKKQTLRHRTRSKSPIPFYKLKSMLCLYVVYKTLFKGYIHIQENKYITVPIWRVR